MNNRIGYKETGLIQIYTGSGKGKTLAALGLAIRAIGHGNSVLFYQFLKPPNLQTGEKFLLEKVNLNITFKSLKINWDIHKSLKDTNVMRNVQNKISKVTEEILNISKNRYYDIIILDEILFCYSSGLVSYGQLKQLVDEKHENVELVFTGRGADKKLIDLADQVSEIKNIKHPFDNGINARKGIDF